MWKYNYDDLHIELIGGDSISDSAEEVTNKLMMVDNHDKTKESICGGIYNAKRKV